MGCLEDNDYLCLSELPFLKDVSEPQLTEINEIPFNCVGENWLDDLMKRMYRLGEVYALAYVRRLYINHSTEIFNGLKAHLKGECSAYDMWGGGDLGAVVEAFEDKKRGVSKYALMWLKHGFYDSLNRFLIMSVLPRNETFNPSLKLSKITSEDINRFILAVLNDEEITDFPFPSFEGWDVGTS